MSKLLGKVEKLEQGESYRAEFSKEDLKKVNNILLNRAIAYHEYKFCWVKEEGKYYAIVKSLSQNELRVRAYLNKN